MTSILSKFDETSELKDINPYTSSVSDLSKGILEMYRPPLINVEKQLTELTTKQDFLITQIHNENLSLAEVRHSPEIKEMFNKLKLYNIKLLNIKKDMKLVYERSSKLKKRAQRLQQAKEKEQQLRVKNEIELLKREQNLIAKPGTSSL